jgi:hypothetical protein
LRIGAKILNARRMALKSPALSAILLEKPHHCPLSRTSAFASRHTALGSGLEDWNGMGTAWSYATNANAEHDAARTGGHV